RHLRAAGRWKDEPQQHLDRRRLPRPVRAEEAEDLPFQHLDGEVADRVHLALLEVPFPEPFGADGNAHGLFSSWSVGLTDNEEVGSRALPAARAARAKARQGDAGRGPSPRTQTEYGAGRRLSSGFLASAIIVLELELDNPPIRATTRRNRPSAARSSQRERVRRIVSSSSSSSISGSDAMHRDRSRS